MMERPSEPGVYRFKGFYWIRPPGQLMQLNERVEIVRAKWSPYPLLVRRKGRKYCLRLDRFDGEWSPVGELHGSGR